MNTVCLPLSYTVQSLHKTIGLCRRRMQISGKVTFGACVLRVIILTPLFSSSHPPQNSQRRRNQINVCSFFFLNQARHVTLKKTSSCISEKPSQIRKICKVQIGEYFGYPLLIICLKKLTSQNDTLVTDESILMRLLVEPDIFHT